MNLNITTLSLSYILFFSLNLFFCVTYASSNTSLVPFAPMGDLKTEDSIASPLVHGCPRSCTTLGSDPANWTQIHDLNTLDRCKEPTLFAFNIHSELHVDTPKVSCSLLDEYPQRVLTSAKTTWKSVDTKNFDAVSQRLKESESCGALVSTVDVTLESEIAGDLGSISNSTKNAVTAVENLASYMTDASSCGSTILFSKYGDSVAAMYAGADVLQSGVGKKLEQLG